MSGAVLVAPERSLPPAPSSSELGRRVVGGLRQVALLPVIGVLIVVGAVINPNFLQLNNFTEIGQFSSSLGVVVVGESLVLLTGGMDLSLESTYGLAPMVAAWTILSRNLFGAGIMLSPYLALLVLLAVGAAVGMTNGLLIVKGRLNGFIVTLGMTILLYGLQDGMVSDQSLFGLPVPFTYLGSAYLFRAAGSGTGGIPVSLVVTAAIFVLVGLFLRYHRIGRAVYAVGGNREAARAAGIKVDRIRIGVYVAAGTLAAIGGLMEAGQTSQVSTLQGYSEGIIFPVFAAAVSGGVSLQGGRGNMLGAATGVILLGIVTNILNISQVSNYWIFAVQGGVILAALVLARIIGGRAAAE
ncbi:MAG TPA: ABC transporter permease [Acidimicrobiales bacterium]|nr:ABC transporter permease [Acidimicrobiales bacterium]